MQLRSLRCSKRTVALGAGLDQKRGCPYGRTLLMGFGVGFAWGEHCHTCFSCVAPPQFSLQSALVLWAKFCARAPSQWSGSILRPVRVCACVRAVCDEDVGKVRDNDFMGLPMGRGGVSRSLLRKHRSWRPPLPIGGEAVYTPQLIDAAVHVSSAARGHSTVALAGF